MITKLIDRSVLISSLNMVLPPSPVSLNHRGRSGGESSPIDGRRVVNNLEVCQDAFRGIPLISEFLYYVYSLSIYIVILMARKIAPTSQTIAPYGEQTQSGVS